MTRLSRHAHTVRETTGIALSLARLIGQFGGTDNLYRVGDLIATRRSTGGFITKFLFSEDFGVVAEEQFHGWRGPHHIEDFTQLWCSGYTIFVWRVTHATPCAVNIRGVAQIQMYVDPFNRFSERQTPHTAFRLPFSLHVGYIALRPKHREGPRIFLSTLEKDFSLAPPLPDREVPSLLWIRYNRDERAFRWEEGADVVQRR